MYGIRTKAFATPAAVSVGTGTTTVLALTPAGLFSAMVVEVSSAVGSATLNSFTVQRQDHAQGAWYNYITAWTSPYSLGLSYASGDPATLAAADVVHLHVDIGSAYGVRLIATVAASTASITAVGLLGDATLPGALAEVSISGFATSAKQLADGHGVLATILPANVTTLTPPAAAAIGTAVDGATNQAAIAADLNELTAAPVEKVAVRVAPVPIASAGTPVVLAANGTFFRRATFQAGRATAANTSLISIGANVAYTTDRQIELAPGDSWTIVAPDGCKEDLNDYYIDGVTAGDAVRIRYLPV